MTVNDEVLWTRVFMLFGEGLWFISPMMMSMLYMLYMINDEC
jgi:hypothetical protein